MSRIIKFFLATSLTLIFFTSCEKSYQCQCGYYSNGTYTTSTHEVLARSYSEAVRECEERNGVNNATGCTIIDNYYAY